MRGASPERELKPVYLLEGESEALAREAEEALRRACFPGGGEEAGMGRWDREGLAEALGFLRTVPFLTARRLAVVTLDPGSGAQDGREVAGLLEDFLRDPPPWAVLVLRSPARVGGALRSLCEKKGAVVPCQVPRADLPGWARERARSRGLGLTAAQAWWLVEVCGGDADLVESELEKLCLAVGSGRPLTDDDLRQHVFPGPAVPFALVDAWAARDAARALASLARLLEQGADPVRLLGGLAWQVRSLLLYHYLQGEGVRSPAELARALETSPAGVKATASRARRFTPGELEAALVLLAEVDYQIKTGQTEPRRALEEFILRTVGSGGC